MAINCVFQGCLMHHASYTIVCKTIERIQKQKTTFLWKKVNKISNILSTLVVHTAKTGLARIKQLVMCTWKISLFSIRTIKIITKISFSECYLKSVQFIVVHFKCTWHRKCYEKSLLRLTVPAITITLYYKSNIWSGY